MNENTFDGALGDIAIAGGFLGSLLYAGVAAFLLALFRHEAQVIN